MAILRMFIMEIEKVSDVFFCRGLKNDVWERVQNGCFWKIFVKKPSKNPNFVKNGHKLPERAAKVGFYLPEKKEFSGKYLLIIAEGCKKFGDQRSKTTVTE